MPYYSKKSIAEKKQREFKNPFFVAKIRRVVIGGKVKWQVYGWPK